MSERPKRPVRREHLQINKNKGKGFKPHSNQTKLDKVKHDIKGKANLLRYLFLINENKGYGKFSLRLFGSAILGANFGYFVPYDFVKISRGCGTNSYKIMYGETLDFNVSVSNGNIKIPIG